MNNTKSITIGQQLDQKGTSDFIQKKKQLEDILWSKMEGPKTNTNTLAMNTIES